MVNVTGNSSYLLKKFVVTKKGHDYFMEIIKEASPKSSWSGASISRVE